MFISKRFPADSIIAYLDLDIQIRNAKILIVMVVVGVLEGE
jgi:hypothetical protein